MARHVYRAKVYSCNGDVLSHVGLQEALQMVENGQALRVSRPKANQLIIVLKPRTAESRRTNASISFREMQANAGEFGYRRRTRRKVRMWPHVHDDRAVITCAGRVCRPKPHSQPAIGPLMQRQLREEIARNTGRPVQP